MLNDENYIYIYVCLWCTEINYWNKKIIIIVVVSLDEVVSLNIVFMKFLAKIL